MFREYTSGLSFVLKAPRFLFNNGLGWSLIIPVVLNVLLLALGFSLTGSLSEMLFEQVFNAFNAETTNEYGILFDFLKGIIWLIFKLLFFLVFAYIGGFVVLILISPLLAYISERTEQITNGTDYPFNFSQFVKDIFRGILMAARNMVFEIGLTVLVIILAFVPIVGLAAPVLLFMISSYYYGFSFLDYNLERRKLSINESIDYIKKHRALAMGVSAPFSLLLLIPVIGTSLAGFMAIFSTVGATLALEELEKQN